MSRPKSYTREERELVVETVVHYWCIGDLKFLYEDEVAPPKGFTRMTEFVGKWGATIVSAEDEILDFIGDSMFGDSWDTDESEA